MIFYYILLFVTSLLTAVFDWLPKITTLPSVLGVDVDTALVQAVGYFHGVAGNMWPLMPPFIGGLVWIGYLVTKNIVIRIFLGGRAPH